MITAMNVPLGRFLSPDPLALASASQNTYHYAASNPFMFNDPLGLKAAAPITGPYALGSLRQLISSRDLAKLNLIEMIFF